MIAESKSRWNLDGHLGEDGRPSLDDLLSGRYSDFGEESCGGGREGGKEMRGKASVRL